MNGIAFPLSTHKGSFHDSDKESKLSLGESFFPNVNPFGQVVGSCKGDPKLSVCFCGQTNKSVHHSIKISSTVNFVAVLVSILMLLGWYGYLSLISLLLWDTFQSVQLYDEKLDEPDLHRALSTSLPQRCIETDIDEFRTNFAVCFLKGVVLNQFSAADSVLPIESNFWRFESIHGDSITEQVYKKTHHCVDETGRSYNESKVIVRMECCRHFNAQHPVHHDFIYPTKRALSASSVTKVSDLLVREVTNHGCETSITVCSAHICKGPSSSSSALAPPTTTILNKDAWQFGNISPREQREQLERVYDVFHHAYQSYMKNAFPKVRFNAVFLTAKVLPSLIALVVSHSFI